MLCAQGGGCATDTANTVTVPRAAMWKGKRWKGSQDKSLLLAWSQGGDSKGHIPLSGKVTPGKNEDILKRHLCPSL